MSIAAQQRKAASDKSATYNPNFAWSKVQQPHTFATVEEYIRLAEENLPHLEREIRKFIGELPFETALIGPCVKGPKRANQKLTDTNSSAMNDPKNIKDYLRLTISPRTVEELQRTIEALEGHEMTVAWKNRFYNPDESTGMRDYKAIWCVGGPNDEMSILAEVKVDYAGMASAYKMTERMRAGERAMVEFKDNAQNVCCAKQDDAKAITRVHIKQADAGETANAIRKLRRDIHDNAAYNLGLNALLNPALVDQHTPGGAEIVIDHYREFEETDFGTKLARTNSFNVQKILEVASAITMTRASDSLRFH